MATSKYIQKTNQILGKIKLLKDELDSLSKFNITKIDKLTKDKVLQISKKVKYSSEQYANYYIRIKSEYENILIYLKQVETSFEQVKTYLEKLTTNVETIDDQKIKDFVSKLHNGWKNAVQRLNNVENYNSNLLNSYEQFEVKLRTIQSILNTPLPKSLSSTKNFNAEYIRIIQFEAELLVNNNYSKNNTRLFYFTFNHLINNIFKRISVKLTDEQLKPLTENLKDLISMIKSNVNNEKLLNSDINVVNSELDSFFIDFFNKIYKKEFKQIGEVILFFSSNKSKDLSLPTTKERLGIILRSSTLKADLVNPDKVKIIKEILITLFRSDKYDSRVKELIRQNIYSFNNDKLTIDDIITNLNNLFKQL